MAIYPDNSIQFPKKVNLVSDINANDVNSAYSEIEAIESTLGTNINGVKSSLKDRLSTSMDEFGNLKAGSVGSATITDNSIQNIKLYNQDTFDFNSINIRQHSGNALYGYTAGAGVNAANSGLTVDAKGNLNTNGDLFSEGVARFNSNNNSTAGLILDQYGSGPTLEAKSHGNTFLTIGQIGYIDIKPATWGDTSLVGFSLRNDNYQVVASHLNDNKSGMFDLYSSDGVTHRLTMSCNDDQSKVYIGTLTDTDLRIKTNDLDRIYIDWQDGNVGINTTSPTVQFEVNGQSKFTGQLNAVGDIITPSINVDNGVLYVDDINNQVGVNTISPSAAFHVVGDQIITGNQSTSGNLYVTQTVNASGLNIDSGLIYVDSANNRVGINNLNPQYSLDVSGTGNISGNTTIGGTLGVTNTITASAINASGDFAINTDKFKVLAASGNTTVGGTLGVTSLLSGSTASFSGLITSTLPASSTSAPLSILNSVKVTNLNSDFLDGQHGSWYQDAGNLNAGTIPSARLSGTYGGITGIGTQTIPLSSSVAIGTAPFTVTSTTKVANLNVDYLDGVSIENIAQTGSAGTIGYISKFTGTSSIANSVIFDNGSNKIGINSNNPTTTLDVSGNGRFTSTLSVEGSGQINGLKVDGDLLVTGTEIITSTETVKSSATITGKLTVNGSCQLGNEVTDTVAISGNATIGGTLGVTNTLTTSAINAGGTLNVLAGTIFTSGASHVGINNPAPAYALDIKTVDTGSGIVLSSSDKALFSAIKPTTGNECDLTLFSGGNPKVYLSTNSESYINNGQFFGIGNSDPGYNLDVTGTGRITGDVLIGGTLGITGQITGNLTGNVTGNCNGTAATVTGAAQNAITSLGTLTGLTMSGNIAMGTKDITGANSITSTTFSGNLTGNVTGNCSGTAATVTGAAQNAITSLGTLTGLTMSGNIAMGTKDITGANSITSTTFSGNLTGNVTGNCSGTAATVTGAAQNAITSLGTLTGLNVSGIITSTHPASSMSAPFSVLNSVKVTNLNVDFLDGVSIENIAQTGGSGASGYISKFTGASSIANSIIFDDGSKIGIGTAIPTYYLDIQKNQSASTTIRLSNPSGGSAASCSMRLTNNEPKTTRFEIFGSGNSTTLGDFNLAKRTLLEAPQDMLLRSIGDMYFLNNNATTMALQAGNVSIGTYTQTGKLTIVNTVNQLSLGFDDSVNSIISTDYSGALQVTTNKLVTNYYKVGSSTNETKVEITRPSDFTNFGADANFMWFELTIEDIVHGEWGTGVNFEVAFSALDALGISGSAILLAINMREVGGNSTYSVYNAKIYKKAPYPSHDTKWYLSGTLQKMTSGTGTTDFTIRVLVSISVY